MHCASPEQGSPKYVGLIKRGATIFLSFHSQAEQWGIVPPLSLMWGTAIWGSSSYAVNRLIVLPTLSCQAIFIDCIVHHAVISLSIHLGKGLIYS